MQDPQHSPAAVHSSSSSAVASSSTSNSQGRQEERGIGPPALQSPESDAQSRRLLLNFGASNWDFAIAPWLARDDAWPCVVILLTFWLFVSLTIILGVYGPIPNSSVLLRPSPLFVQYMKVNH
ncbi:uncharacterized protein LOC114760274 [Neltuma alba]|uniref:uncharacterized protein LOC114760274 n=1 Tax=Neltuma alba TaxID=207710 RepID=UPI0010A310CF|nr:uncharacterized protein LOC114760274 [Prosopis alba]